MSHPAFVFFATQAAFVPALLASPDTESVTVQQLQPLHALVLPMRGAHAQHDAAFGRLVAELRSLGAVPQGPPFGRYFNSVPQVSESELVWEIGIPVGPDVISTPPFQVQDVPGGETAVLVHAGPYASSASSWPVLLNWIVGHGYRPVGPAMQVYLGNPDLPGALGPRTELRLPVARLAAGGETPATIDGRWASSEDLRIVIHSKDAADRVLTEGHRDYKPSWSPDGKMLTFFRLVRSGPEFKDWRTRLCVINADGTGFRELTSGASADFNPTWTRDGSRRIVFNRYSSEGGWRNRVYWTLPSASPGDEQLVSDPAYAHFEWVTGALRDGRLLVDRVTPSSAESFLLTPDPGRAGRYQRVTRPSGQVWHKLTVSPSERRVAYMLDFDRNAASFEDVVLYYADFDAATLTISNPVAITDRAAGAIHEYPAWSRDESVLYYDGNLLGRYQLFAYRLADGVTTRVSPRAEHDYQFVALEGQPR